MSTLPFVDASPLVAHLASHGDRVALVGGGAPDGGLTYAGLAARVAAFAGRLGTTRRLVLVEGGNDSEALVAYLGAHAAGCPVLLTGPGQARDALVAAYDPDVCWTHDDGLIERRARPAVELHPDLALLLSTSGTTGSPKLVRLSRDNLLANARQIAEYLGLRETDVAATTLPLHYCYGLSVVHSHLLVGARLVLTDASVADEAFWELATAQRVTSFAGVPHTFELLDRVGFAERSLPSLRQLTQAGGRMAPDTVRRYAALGAQRGFELFVMYGATEATARMAYLPPILAASAPSTIGIPVPGGSLHVEPFEPGSDVGELVYRGENVMLGYAETPADLALGRTVHELRTGDVGRQREDGLFEVTGRRSRFVKVFGLRIELDRVEQALASRGVVAAAADGGDSLVVAVASGAASVDARRVLAAVREETGVPPAGVRLLTPPELPRLATGKVDYRALVVEAALGDLPVTAPQRVTAGDVAALYRSLLGAPAGPGDSFRSLGGDSLSYVEASMRLEEMLGRLPADWPTRSAAELAAVAGPVRRGRVVEGSVLLRALAIVAIVGSHANLFAVVGGAHVLLGVLGFNFGRFHADSPRAERARAVARSLSRVVVPSMLVIGIAALVTDGLGWAQVLLVNGLFGPEQWSEPQWHYWFIEAALALTLAAALLLAVPQVDQLSRRFPFWLPFGLALVGLVPRYGCRDVVDDRGGPHHVTHHHDGILGLLPEGDFIHRAHAVFWLFALGWAAARATTVWHRLLVSAVVVVTVPGFFLLEPERDRIVVLGMLALVWVTRVRMPAVAASVLGVLAAASMWIYLIHWQVYPHLEDRLPLAATASSLLAGVLAWWVWGWIGRLDPGAGMRRARRRLRFHGRA